MMLYFMMFVLISVFKSPVCRVAVFSCILPLCCDIVAGKYVMWGVGVRFCVCLYLCVCVCVCIRWRGQGRGARLPRKWMCWPHQRAPSWCGFGSSSWQAHGQGGVCICAALALSWRGLGRFGASPPPTRQVLKGTHPLPPHNPTGLYTGSKNL